MARIQWQVDHFPQRRTVEAYQALFDGRGSKEDARLVLDDLEGWAGFWDVTTADTPNEQVKFAEGQRSVFGRIQALTRVSGAVLDLAEHARNVALEDAIE